MKKTEIKRDVCCIILFDADKKILLQHRDDRAPILPNYWGFFGGGMEKDESKEQTVKRECLEELNYILQNPKLFLSQKYSIPEKNVVGIKHVFIEECVNKNVLKLGEGQGWGWFTFEEAMKLKITDQNKEVLEFLRNELS